MTYEQFITLLKVYINLYRQVLYADALSQLLKKKTASSYYKENYLILIPQDIIKREKTAIERLTVHDSKDPRLGNLIGERLDGGITIHLTYKTIINHLPSLINNLVHGYITKHPKDREKLLSFLGDDPILGNKATSYLHEIRAVLEHHIQKKTNLTDWSRAREIAAKETRPISEQDCCKTIQERYISHQKKLQTRLNIGCDQPLLTWYDVSNASIGVIDYSQKNLSKRPSLNSNKGLTPLLTLFHQYAGDYLHYQKLKETFPLNDFAGNCPEDPNETLLDDVILSLDDLTSAINRLPRKLRESLKPLKTLISEVRGRIQACTQNLTKQNMTRLCVSLEKLFKHDLDMLVTLVITAGVDPKYEEKLQAVIKKKINAFIDVSQKEADKKFSNTVRNFKKEYFLYNQRQAIIKDIKEQIDKRYSYLESKHVSPKNLDCDVNFIGLLSDIRNKQEHVDTLLRGVDDTKNSSAVMMVSFRVGILAEELLLYANKLSKITRKPISIEDTSFANYSFEDQVSEVRLAVGTIREDFRTEKFRKTDNYYYWTYQKDKNLTQPYSEVDQNLILSAKNNTLYPVGQHILPILADVPFITVLERFLSCPPSQKLGQRQFSIAEEIFTWAHGHGVKATVAVKVIEILRGVENQKNNYTPDSLHSFVVKTVKPALKNTRSDGSVFGTPRESKKKDALVQNNKKNLVAKDPSLIKTKKLKLVRNTVNNSTITNQDQVIKALEKRGYQVSRRSVNSYFKELNIKKIDGVYKQQSSSPKKGTTLYSGLAVFGPGNIRMMVEQTKILAVKAADLFKATAVYVDSQKPRWKVVVEGTKQSVHTHVSHSNITRDVFITDANRSFAYTSSLVQTNLSRFNRTVTNIVKGSTRAFISRGGMDMTGTYLITIVASPFTHDPRVFRRISDFSVFVTAPLEHFVHSTQGTKLGTFGTASFIIRNPQFIKAALYEVSTNVGRFAVQGSRLAVTTAVTAETGAVVCLAVPTILVTDMLVNAPEKNASSVSDFLHLYQNGAMRFDQVLSATHPETYKFNQTLEEDSPLKKMMLVPAPSEIAKLTSNTELSFNNGFGDVVLVVFNNGIKVHSLKGPTLFLPSNPTLSYLSSGQ